MENDLCLTCASADVCKYKDKFIAATKIVNDLEQRNEELIRVLVLCKHHNRSNYIFYSNNVK